MGYASPKGPDGRYHSIRVRVKGGGDKVRARNGYVDGRGPARIASVPEDAMTRRMGRRMGVVRLVAATTVAVTLAGLSAVHAQQGPSPVVLASRDEQIPVTLIADCKAVNRDRDVESTTVFPATIVVPALNGGEDRLAVNLRMTARSFRARLSTASR